MLTIYFSTYKSYTKVLHQSDIWELVEAGGAPWGKIRTYQHFSFSRKSKNDRELYECDRRCLGLLQKI